MRASRSEHIAKGDPTVAAEEIAAAAKTAAKAAMDREGRFTEGAEARRDGKTEGGYFSAWTWTRKSTAAGDGATAEIGRTS